MFCSQAKQTFSILRSQFLFFCYGRGKKAMSLIETVSFSFLFIQLISCNKCLLPPTIQLLAWWESAHCSCLLALPFHRVVQGAPHTASGALKATPFALTSAFVKLLGDGCYRLGGGKVKCVQKAFGSFTWFFFFFFNNFLQFWASQLV